MIFQRALRRELVSAAGATFTVLFTIMVTWTLITILGKAAGGKVASNDVVALLVFAALNYLPTILILTSFISVLMVVTRSYRDSEMVVWFASGLSLTRWIGPVLSFGLPMVVLTALLSFVATPWARHKSSDYIERFEKREDLQKVSPGQFKESASSNRIFFVEGAAGKNSAVQNVFVNTVDERGTAIVVAKEGVVNNAANGERFLVLKNGRRYQGTPGLADFQTMEFESYTMRVASQAQELGADLNVDALSTSALFADPNNFTRAEILWRIASPLTCLVLVLLAIPLGCQSARRQLGQLDHRAADLLHLYQSGQAAGGQRQAGPPSVQRVVVAAAPAGGTDRDGTLRLAPERQPPLPSDGLAGRAQAQAKQQGRRTVMKI